MQARPTQLAEFPRINMAHAPQTKAHMRALLASGAVSGWDDPRLPTVRGLLRQGLMPQVLCSFLLEQVGMVGWGAGQYRHGGVGCWSVPAGRWPAAGPWLALATPGGGGGGGGLSLLLWRMPHLPDASGRAVELALVNRACAGCLLPAACCLLPAACCLLPAASLLTRTAPNRCTAALIICGNGFLSCHSC